MPDAGSPASDDKAWVTIQTALDANELLQLSRDPERLFRVNPFWKFITLEHNAPTQFRLCVDNQANGQQWETDASVMELPDGCRVEFAQGLKTSTTFRIVATPEGKTQLVITDDYSGAPAAERQARLNEVDNSLLPWGQALQRYLRSYKRWDWLPVWRWYERRLWRPATPSARRIMGMLIWATVAELAIFIALVAVFMSRTPIL